MKPLIMIDCSHGNSGKDHLKVEGVFQDVMEQIFNGSQSIIGVMIESHIHAGNQSLEKNGTVNDLKYGISISDPCLDWINTKRIILEAYQKIREMDSSGGA